MAFLRNPGGSAPNQPEYEYTVNGIPLDPNLIEQVKKLNLSKGSFISIDNNQLIAYGETQTECLRKIVEHYQKQNIKPPRVSIEQLGMEKMVGQILSVGTVEKNVEHMVNGTPLNLAQIEKIQALKLPKGTWVCFHQNDLIVHAETHQDFLKQVTHHKEYEQAKSLLMGQLGMLRPVFEVGDDIEIEGSPPSARRGM